LFFFTREENGKIVYNQVDLERAMNGTDFETLTPGTYRMPTKSTVVFSGAA
jgi:hypothetical protein